MLHLENRHLGGNTMKCPACKAQLPNDSEFCQYCGQKIEFITSDKTVVQNDTSLTEKPQVLDTAALVDSSDLTNGFFQDDTGMGSKRKDAEVLSQHHAESQKRKSRKKHAVWTIVLSVLLVLTTALNIYQFVVINNHRKKIGDLEVRFSTAQGELTTTEEQLTKIKEQYSKQNEQYVALMAAHDAADKIYDALAQFEYGSRYSDYYSDTEVVVIHIGEKKTVKIHYTGNSTISFQNMNTIVANAEWANNWRKDGIDLYITGKTTGTSTIELANEGNNHKFNILVVVLP